MTNQIPYGEGWPWPKKEPREGTEYRLYHDMLRDNLLVLAKDSDGTVRGVEMSGRHWAAVTWPRRPLADEGTMISGPEDYETVLSSPEAWRTGGDGR